MKKCEKCGEPLEYEITVLGARQKISCICSCRKKELQEREEREAKAERERNRMICFNGSSLKNCTFENSDDSRYTQIARNYADHFRDLAKMSKGLLLYGNVGTGKSHLAACIANKLIDQGYKVLMTNFATIINQLQASFDGRKEYIDSLNRYALLILDDLGAERNTEYMQEQVFNIIDSRYLSGLPMIVTTNLTSSELKKPDNIGSGRIYDRILERCHPVEVSGVSMRRKKIKDDFMEMERMLKSEKG